jgi:hypothetical protein
MLDVLNGTGIDKSASNALKDGSSMLTKFAKLLTITVNHMIQTVLALIVIKDMVLEMEFVLMLILYVRPLMLMEHVLAVSINIFSITHNVLPFQIWLTCFYTTLHAVPKN